MHRFPLISSNENRLNFDSNQPRENSFEIDVNHPASINKQPSKTKGIVSEIWRLGYIPENGFNTLRIDRQNKKAFPKPKNFKSIFEPIFHNIVHWNLKAPIWMEDISIGQ